PGPGRRGRAPPGRAPPGRAPPGRATSGWVRRGTDRSWGSPAMTQAGRQRTRPVGLLILAFLFGGLLIDLLVLRLNLPKPAAFGVAFGLATLAFAVTEAVVMHVELGKNAHSVS